MVQLLGRALHDLETNDNVYFKALEESATRTGTHLVIPYPFGLLLGKSVFRFHYVPLIASLLSLTA